MQISSTWKRMAITVMSLSLVAYFAFDSANPGREASDEELATIRATAEIKGMCVNGAACTGDSGVRCLFGGACAGLTGQYCDTCSGAAHQVCTAMPSSPYSCVDDLADQFCCQINKECQTINVPVIGLFCTCTGVPPAPLTFNNRKRC